MANVDPETYKLSKDGYMICCTQISLNVFMKPQRNIQWSWVYKGRKGNITSVIHRHSEI